MSAYFITATGTGVGKTFATCALIDAAQRRGVAVQACKPIISGYDATQKNDTQDILATLSNSTTADSISPWRFTAPLSPHMAAAQEGRRIDPRELTEWTIAQLKKASGLMLIEGVGGVMVPIDGAFTTREWMASLKIPVILVAGNYLGSISHTLTALEALHTAGIPVKALVVSEREPCEVPLAETVKTLASFTDADVLAQPQVSDYTHATAIHSLLDIL